jgi:hypothetical protein
MKNIEKNKIICIKNFKNKFINFIEGNIYYFFIEDNDGEPICNEDYCKDKDCKYFNARFDDRNLKIPKIEYQEYENTWYIVYSNYKKEDTGKYFCKKNFDIHFKDYLKEIRKRKIEKIIQCNNK